MTLLFNAQGAGAFQLLLCLTTTWFEPAHVPLSVNILMNSIIRDYIQQVTVMLQILSETWCETCTWLDRYACAVWVAHVVF